MGILHPQECYLLEQTITVDAYKKRYEHYKRAIEIAESRYLEIMRNIPADYRNRAINQQLDITWGSCVLPNLRDTLNYLERDYILRLHNDPKAYPSGGGIGSDAKGMYADMGVDTSWMGTEAEKQFDHYFFKARKLDDNIRRTTRNGWIEHLLTYRFISEDNNYNFGLNLPTRIPRYELVPDVVLEIGEKPTITGLYLPSVPHASAAFLYPRINDYDLQANQVSDLDRFVDEDTGEVFYSWDTRTRLPSKWTLIRRIENDYIDVPPEGFFPNHHPEELYNWPEREKIYLNQQSHPRITVWSGQTCPHSGRWATLMYRGMEYSHFKQGQVIPNWLDDYGDKQQAKWTLLERDDGGSPLIESHLLA